VRNAMEITGNFVMTNLFASTIFVTQAADITLPNLTQKGQMIRFLKTTANAVNVEPSGGENINDAASPFSLATQFQWYTCVGGTTSWYIS
jgi:hypothetical protein